MSSNFSAALLREIFVFSRGIVADKYYFIWILSNINMWLWKYMLINIIVSVK